MPASGKIGCLAIPLVLLALPARPAAADEVRLKKGGNPIRCMLLSEECRICHGRGVVTCPTCAGKGVITGDVVCPRCDGRGTIACPACEGRGYPGEEISVLVQGNIRLTIPLSEIESIQRGPANIEDFLPPRQAYKKRLGSLDDNSADAHFQLAHWAYEAGLEEEAQIHFLKARLLDPAVADKVRPFIEEIQKKREERVERSLRGTLKDIMRADYAAALKGLEELLERHPESPLLRARSLQERIMREELGIEASRWGLTADELVASLRYREALLCPDCRGAGTVLCTQCAGRGSAACARCNGTGCITCPDCNGTTRAVCPTCLGTGRKEQLLGFGPAITTVCPTCKGRGAVKCQRCHGKGGIACPECQGRGQIKGACPACKGSGKAECATCLGTGLRRPVAYRWGPYPVFPALAKNDTLKPSAVLGFQARYKGALVTLLTEQAVYGGRLAVFVGRKLATAPSAAGPPKQTATSCLLLCVDNREGSQVIALGAQGRFLRLVSAEAAQLEMMPPAQVRQRLEAAGAAERLLEAAAPGEVLPGAVRNVVCMFPAGLGDFTGYRAFFGEQEVVEMDAVSAPKAETATSDGLAAPPPRPPEAATEPPATQPPTAGREALNCRMQRTPT